MASKKQDVSSLEFTGMQLLSDPRNTFMKGKMALESIQKRHLVMIN